MFIFTLNTSNPTYFKQVIDNGRFGFMQLSEHRRRL